MGLSNELTIYFSSQGIGRHDLTALGALAHPAEGEQPSFEEPEKVEAALARSDQEVATVLQKISPSPDKTMGAATSPAQAVSSPLLPGARSLPVLPIGR